MTSRAAWLAGVLGLLAGAAAAGPQDASGDLVVPEGLLPDDVRPTRYRLVLDVDPTRERFGGKARIDVELDRPRAVLWLHGRGLRMRSSGVVSGTEPPVRARWEQVNPAGVAELRPERAVGPGRVTLRLAWDAPVDGRLRGVFRVDVGGTPYVFTQFEPTLARQAFPSFDEPRRKTPFELTLVVPEQAAAVANAPIVDERGEARGRRRVRFAATPPLPTYLLAFAVGPLDVVDAPPLGQRPVPFRGVATRARGAALGWALARTPRLFDVLEGYFGIPYPYEKLDVLAVPDMAGGGMENAGAITFRESILLLDPAAAPESQRRRFANIMAHELAHQWFGDLVTMAWWDDLWLNEAFATWIASRTVDRVHPEYRDALALLASVHDAMDADSLESARRIRQPIASTHDIWNAFDDITYRKGAGVLAMFERWLGEKAFRRGIRRYLDRHAFATATTDDLLGALSDAAGRDVAAPVRSFLEQPGVPLVAARLACSEEPPHLDLEQWRWLPVGSSAARTGPWQIPVCVRYGAGSAVRDACTLLVERLGSLALEGPCPAWVMPNAGGSGYYRWSLPDTELARLRDRGWARLGPGERLSVADSLAAGFAAATLPASEALGSLPLLARDPARQVAVAPMPLVRFVRQYVATPDERRAVQAFARALYAPVWAALGWTPSPREDGDRKLLRAAVIRFLASEAGDVRVRRRAAAEGERLVGASGDGTLDLAAAPPELVEALLAIAVEEGGAAVFDPLVADLHASQDDFTRGRILGALGSARDPVLAARARALALDPAVRIGETMRILWAQVEEPETREPTWAWMQANFDTLVAHLPQRAAGQTPWLASGFCDAARAEAVAAFFTPRIEALPGGPRNLAGALESIRLCAARVAAQRESTRDFLRRAAR